MDDMNIDKMAEMSDEDFAKLPEGFFLQDAQGSEPVEETPEQQSEPTDGETGSEEEPVEDTSDAYEADDDERGESEEQQEADLGDGPEQNEDSGESQEGEEGTGATDDEPMKTAYAAIFKSHRANGSDFTPRSPEEVVALMQKGLNYEGKMTAIKPLRRQGKMLANSGIKTDEDLAFLIALKNHEPEAIAQLLKDADMDPLDINTEKAAFVPKVPQVSDKELALDDTFDSIRHTPSFERTIDVIGNKWDSASRDQMVTNPVAIATLNEHISNGTYDKVMEEVKRGRIMGQLIGLTDKEAYEAVGLHMAQSGQLAGMPTPASGANSDTSQKKAAESDSSLRKRKQAVSRNRGKPVSQSKARKGPSDVEIDKMSDDEFVAWFAKQTQN